MTISTKNYYRHDRGRSFSVEYTAKPSLLIQKRFSGRTVLVPNISLTNYECRALIDWITVSVALGRRTQHRYINLHVNALLGKRAWVKGLDQGAGNASENFEITFQEPDLNAVRQCLDEIFREFGFTAEPVVTGLEVSLDFKPKKEGELERSALFAVLTRHLYIDILKIADQMRMPRFIAGTKVKYLLNTRSSTLEPRLHDLEAHELDASPPADATFYIGEKGDRDHLVRIQNKITDQRNPALRTVENLSEDETRVRIEVTLGQVGLKREGIRTLEDLAKFRYSRLSTKYFRFRLPTFVMGGKAASDLPGRMSRFREGLRLQKFLASGIIGLVALDTARDRLAKSRRHGLIAYLAAKGKCIHTRSEVTRVNGSLVAWDEMSRKIEQALRHLEERMARTS